MSFLRKFLHTPVLYPITACYMCGVTTMVAVVAGWIPFGTGVAAFGFACVLIVLGVMYVQVTVVQSLVHDALITRVDQLLQTLEAGGIAVPHDPTLRPPKDRTS